jgi:catechol 2,3-dioxygenase-like lactoylglutathione lyase family enzyme
MKPKISMITLGVEDLEVATAFYRDGLELPQFNFESAGVSFFELAGTWLALYPKKELAEDIGINTTEMTGSPSFTLAHNVSSPEAVDAVLEQAVTAGGRLIKSGQPVFWGGYSGYFQDPEGYYWEIAFNPFIDLT